MTNKFRKINNLTYYLGANDRKTHLFENNWPLPHGVSYNSYLIADKFSALIDTIEYGSDKDFLSNINEVLGGKPLDYLIVNHMEPDHSGSVGVLLQMYPSLKVVGNAQTLKIMSSYFKLNHNNFITVKDGETLSLGTITLTFALVPWVHWPETMVTLDVVNKVLYSCDAFGSFGTLDGGIFDDQHDFEAEYLDDMRRYYSNIVGKYSGMVQKALEKLKGVEVKVIAPSHGLIWRSNPAKVLSLYDEWSRYQSEKGVVIAYASMYGNTEKMADAIAAELCEKGIRNIKIYDVSKTHASYILSEIWKYDTLILGTCAYNTQMHPMMEHLCNEIKLIAPKNKTVAIFGSSSWNGAGVKNLRKFVCEMGMDIVEPVVETFGADTQSTLAAQAQKLVEVIAEKIR